MQGNYRNELCSKSIWFQLKHGLKRYVNSSKISHITVFFLILFLLFHYLNDHFFKFPSNNIPPPNNPVDPPYRFRDLKDVDELKRIKKSVSTELRDLENKRNQIQNDISVKQDSLANIDQNVKKAHLELDKLKREITQLKNERREAAKPKMAAPARLLASDEDNIDFEPPKYYSQCVMNDCFDYSRCSLTSQFPVYVYPIEKHTTEDSPFPVTPYISSAVQHALSRNALLTSDPKVACLYVAVLGEVEKTSGLYSSYAVDNQSASNWLRSLPFWRGDGRNHLLLYLTRQTTVQNPLWTVDTGRAIVAQSNFNRGQFRKDFDIIIPSLAAVGTVRHNAAGLEQEVDHVPFDQWKEEDEAWSYDDIPLQVPAQRTYLLSFQGQWSSQDNADLKLTEQEERIDQEIPVSKFHQVFMDSLKLLKTSPSMRNSYIEMKCSDNQPVVPGHKSEWAMCGTFTNRAAILSHSTFVLVPPPERNPLNAPVVSSLFVTRLAEALRAGAIPVIPGTADILPFSEYVNWEKAALVIPQARITELSLLLHSYPHEDLLSLRRQARFLYETYFSTTSQVLTSVLALVRSRLQIPPLPLDDVESNVVEHSSYKIEEREPSPGDAKSEFGFPPSEPKIDSKRFRHNFTQVSMDTKNTWNAIPGPFQLFPHLPWDRALPTDAQFLGSSDGFRPIGGGVGGTGRVYQESLGGNHPREQFTIVMLTYERDDVLMQAIERLVDLPHLNKVVVVWNSPKPPSDDLHWPDIGVEVAVVHAVENSLNNRFAPWDVINTEAVLSIDDDAHLRHDEILFGFRVWRQNRDRVVGFPGRFHAWDERSSSWAYDSNHTCELSMVLTGAAFIHKYYMYLYTNWMPSVVRDIVDEYMNCEDIAMNFLVSHVTRKPPVKVTSRWTFRCPGCPVALSQSDEHFLERHKCINSFVKIFGYMPLLYTQYRVDSILFKTRLPHDKQKCFKFI